MSNHINFSNSWLVSLDWKNNKWKNYEAQSPINQISNDEIKKKLIT
jgi:hypothetical protein